MSYVLAACIGLFSGISSGLFGIGGGIIMVPAMMFVLQTGIGTAIGTSLAVIVPTALVGACKHFLHGNVDWKLALSLAPMALVGGWAGAWLTTVMTPDQLKRLFGALLVVVGIRLMLFR